MFPKMKGTTNLTNLMNGRRKKEEGRRKKEEPRGLNLEGELGICDWRDDRLGYRQVEHHRVSADVPLNQWLIGRSCGTRKVIFN